MISIDEHPPPDPSSDNQNYHLHHQQQKVSHEAFASVSDIDLLKPTHTNNNNNSPLPNFSIRGYVLESRCKDIARNWPFSDKSLRLCLNYGVKNLLPPFQSPDSVRNYSSVSVSTVENGSPNEETISNSLAHTKAISQPIVKKSKLVMKLNSGIEPIEETVASKVCPVCKTFSSSSNTTLNAHIDSCLSEESGMKQTEDLKLKTIKQYRIKPRKTRLMLDVYKTAPHCTIEELDRRNGTNWATNSSFPDQEIEFQAEEKEKDEPQEPVFTPEVADHEGAVYVDKNGKKVRILSIPKLTKVVIKKKKKKAYMQKHFKKILKLSPNSKKLTKKVESGQKESANPIKAQVNKQMDDLAITRPPWACSKRTSGAKKRASVHTKRKEDNRLDDSSDHSVRSKGAKFSSLRKSLSMPTRQEHNQEPTLINLKRKFSALHKSQDSLKQVSITEEDTSKEMSFEMTNVREVKKKKSVTSESSNDDSLCGGLDITSESARTEECIGVEPSFTGLKNSFDNEFSKMISQLDNKFDSQHCTLDDIIMDHDNEKQGNYYNEVDPIPIPGPPGSFLPPSPGADMGSEEEPQGNSSLTTMSRVQSSEERRGHEIMNQDFISGSSVSTVSSPRFDKKSVNNNINDNNNNNNNNNTSDLRSVDAIFKEKGVTTCCCSRKEGAFFNNLALYPQESAVPKERVTESNGLRRPETLFPLANHLTLPPPGMVKSPAISPTTLRLMGKNLTVVNTDNEQVKPHPCSSPIGQYHYQQLHKVQNENHDSFFYSYPPQYQNSSMSQCFNLYPPNNSRTRSANIDNSHDTDTATKEIIVIDDSSDNERDDHRHNMFKEPMIRNHTFSFTNQYGINGSMQTSSSHLQEVVNDGNRGGWVSTAYYPRNFS